MSTCFQCGREIEGTPVGVRDCCEGCHAYLHCCRNCRHYEPGAHNDCRETQADLVADKERGNFCDFFALRRDPADAPGIDPDAAKNAAHDRLESLFRKT